MKDSILLTTYHEAFLHRGGGEYELLETALNLRKLGFTADVYSPFSRELEYYDTILHFSIEESGLSILKAARRERKRIILWPNFWLGDGHLEGISELGRRFLELADAIVFKSRTEKNFFGSLIPFGDIPTLYVPVGVDPCFLTPPPGRLFRDSLGLEDYILWIGIIEPCKNQLRTINALRELSIPIVFIGNYRDAAYYEACQAAAPEHCIFLEPIAHKSDLMRAAIRECKLYIEPTLEPAGKSVIEAAVAGAPILTSDSEWAREHFGEHAIYVNPLDEESVLRGVRQGLEWKKQESSEAPLIQRHILPDVLKPLSDFLESR